MSDCQRQHACVQNNVVIIAAEYLNQWKDKLKGATLFCIVWSGLGTLEYLGVIGTPLRIK